MLDMRWKALDRAVNLSQSQLNATLPSRLFWAAPFRAGTLGPASQIAPFRSIDAVGSELLTRPLEHIDCDTHQRTPKNSSIKLLYVLVLGFVRVCNLRAVDLLRALAHLGRFRWP